MRDPVLAVGFDGLLAERGAGRLLQPHADDLTKGLIGQSERLRLQNILMGEQVFLDLLGRNVLATANDRVLDAPDDRAVAVLVNHPFVAGFHPAVDDRLSRFLCVVPVPLHDAVAFRADLTALAARRGVAARVDHLDLDVRMHGADRGGALGEGVVDGGLKAHRAGLGHPVAVGNLTHMQIVENAPHQHLGAQRAGHDPGAQTADIETGKLRVIEDGAEHRGHAVQRRAALILHGAQRRHRIEGVGGQHQRGAMRAAGQRAHHHAEAVIQRHRHAQSIRGAEADAATDKVPVVDDIVVRERRALG